MHLIQKNQVVVEHVEVDGVKELDQHLVVHGVVASLFQGHAHDTAKDFEEVFDDVVSSFSRDVLQVVFDGHGEFLFQCSNLFTRQCSLRNAFTISDNSFAIVLLRLMANKAHIQEQIM